MKRFLLTPLLILVLPFAAMFGLTKLAMAMPVESTMSIAPLIASTTGSGSASAVVATQADVATGSGSAVTVTTTTTATPADAVHDPLTQPAAALDDVKAAKRLGWPALIFVIALLVGRVGGELGKRKSIGWLAWLAKGKAAVVVAGIAAIGAAGYNSAVEGGTVYAMLFAAVGAGFALLNPHADDKATEAES